jgi:chromosome segregation ATPase
VPEISAANLRRLKELDVRLRKARKESRALNAERRKLRSSARANAQRAREATKKASALEEKLEEALAANRALAEKLETAAADAKALQAAGLKLRAELEAARDDLAKAEKTAAATQKEAEALRAECDRLTEGMDLAKAQLTGKQAPALPAAEVSKLVDGFVEDLGSRLSGLAVRDGELKLKVGFEKAGRRSGFVVPSATSPPGTAGSLHEISIRFDREAEADD